MPKSKSDAHITPNRVWEIIFDKWGYVITEFFDPCPKFCVWDGLQINWEKLNYVNPPYTQLKEFVAKALEEAKKGNVTIMLLPSKTDQHWFHTIKKYEIEWIEKRLKFEGEKGATQPHFLVMIK